MKEVSEIIMVASLVTMMLSLAVACATGAVCLVWVVYDTIKRDL